MEELTGKVAVVTGGAVGIGEATVRMLAGAGATVYIADTDEVNGSAVAGGLQARGQTAVFIPADIASEPDVRDLFRRVETDRGRLDVLVNNAGIARVAAPDEVSREDWDRVLAVNLTGAALCTKHALPLLRKAGGGSIVNVSSIYALVSSAGLAAYAASKGGLAAMTRSHAVELGPEGIRVNAVMPGYTRTSQFLGTATKLGEGDPERFIAQLTPGIALRRIALPDEIARAILFLATEESSYMTGASLVIDGGVCAEV